YRIGAIGNAGPGRRQANSYLEKLVVARTKAQGAVFDPALATVDHERMAEEEWVLDGRALELLLAFNDAAIKPALFRAMHIGDCARKLFLLFAPEHVIGNAALAEIVDENIDALAGRAVAHAVTETGIVFFEVGDVAAGEVADLQRKVE